LPPLGLRVGGRQAFRQELGSVANEGSGGVGWTARRISVPLLTAPEIGRLRNLEKPVPGNWKSRLPPTVRKRDHTQGHLDLRRVDSDVVRVQGGGELGAMGH
jgi:hypothetical protein